MARKSKDEKDKYSESSGAKVADIIVASKSLAEGKSYEEGYPDQFKGHINEGGSGRRLKGGKK